MTKITPTFIFFHISEENDQICTKISVNVAERIQISAIKNY